MDGALARGDGASRAGNHEDGSDESPTGSCDRIGMEGAARQSVWLGSEFCPGSHILQLQGNLPLFGKAGLGDFVKHAPTLANSFQFPKLSKPVPFPEGRPPWQWAVHSISCFVPL